MSRTNYTNDSCQKLLGPTVAQNLAYTYLRHGNISREDIFARGYFREKIFSREDIFAEDIFALTVYARKYLLAKIFQINFSRNFPPAKIKCYTVTLYFRGSKISRKVNFKYFREKIFSRILFTRKYLPAKISSRENNILAKISSRENIFPRKYPLAKIFSHDFFPCRKYVG